MENKNGFWRWYNHIWLKFFGGLLLSLILMNAENRVFASVGAIIAIFVICYGIFLLGAVLYCSFVIVPRSEMAKDYEDAAAKVRKEQDRILNEYGRIDSFDNDK